MTGRAKQPRAAAVLHNSQLLASSQVFHNKTQYQNENQCVTFIYTVNATLRFKRHVSTR